MTNMSSGVPGLLLGTVLALSGCRPAPPGPVVVTETDRAEAQRIYTQRCASCHGETGGGDGVAGRALVPPARNFRDAAWQSSVTDQRIEGVIRHGGAAWGLSPMMPANPDLAGSAAGLAAMRERVRSFGPTR